MEKNGVSFQKVMSQLTFEEVSKWPVPPTTGNSVLIGRLERPIWTETKANLIQKYLQLFLYITHHGTYIDAFAGPQNNNSDSWAAKLVLEMEPKWLRHFFLCELKHTPYDKLVALVKSQPEVRKRIIEHNRADCNLWIKDHVLKSKVLTEKEATFALLDQRSFECHWETVRLLADQKKQGNKIELFYFFPTGWLARSITAQQDMAVLDKWWGSDEWRQLLGVRQSDAADIMSGRIRSLGYKDVKAWPITQKEQGEGRVMYHMIHATDHLEAPKLMYRAYTQLVNYPIEVEQIDWINN